MGEEEEVKEDIVPVEIVKKNNSNPKKPETFHQSINGVSTANYVNYLQEVSSPEEFVSASGTMIGGTISTLDALNATIRDFEKRTFLIAEPNINEKLTKDLKPIQQDMESAKKQIEDTSNTLKTLEGFIENNKASFTNLIAVEGKMNGIQGQLSSIQNRVERLENEKNINWNKTTVIISIIIAIISACITLVSVIVAVYQYFK